MLRVRDQNDALKNIAVSCMAINKRDNYYLFSTVGTIVFI